VRSGFGSVARSDALRPPGGPLARTVRDRAISERTPVTNEVTSLTYTSKTPADAQLRASLKSFGITGSAMDKVLPLSSNFHPSSELICGDFTF
jgi:hypothetical protein